MGWFSRSIKAMSRPDKILKDPKKATQFAFDPAGSTVRAGRGKEMPNTFRSTLDPGGFFDGREHTNYAPYQPGQTQMHLSPQAQALYDDMKARSAAREAARQSAAGAAGTGAVTPPAIRNPRFQGSVMADGGQPKRKLDCEHFESKVFARRKNGKPS